MTTVSINGKKSKIPQSWDEVKKNEKLFFFALGLFFQNLNERDITFLFAVRAVGFSSVYVKRLERNLKFEDLDSQLLALNLAYLAEQFNFIVEEKPEIEKNYVPQLLKFFAPKSVLAETVVWEYALADNYFMNYSLTNEEQYLDKLISVLYREKLFFSRKRKKFDETKIEFIEKKVKSIPIELKWLVYRWFAVEKEIIIKAHPNVFSEGTGDGEGGNWGDTIIALSSVGDEDKTANTKLALVLRRIENENRNAKKQEKQ